MTHSIFFAVAAREQRSSRVAEKTTYVFFYSNNRRGIHGGGFCLLGIYIFFVVSFLYFRFSFVFALTSKFIRINTIRWLFLRNFFIHAHVKKPKRKTNKKRFVVTMRSLIALLTSKRDLLCEFICVSTVSVCV